MPKRSDSSGVIFRATSVRSHTSMLFHQTSPTSYFDREVQLKPRVPNTVLAGPFPVVSMGSVGKRNRGSRARTFSLAGNAWQLLS